MSRKGEQLCSERPQIFTLGQADPRLQVGDPYVRKTLVIRAKLELALRYGERDAELGAFYLAERGAHTHCLMQRDRH